MVRNTGWRTALTHAVLILGTVMIAFPIYMALVASTHEARDVITRIPLWFGGEAWANYKVLLGTGAAELGLPPVGRMMFNSMIMALGITMGKLSVSLIAAYAVVFFRFPLRKLFFWMIFMTLMLPVEVRILPTFEVISQLDMLNSHVGLILPLTASATATFLFRQFYLTVPDELFEAARIDGAGPIRFFWDHILPLSRTNIAAMFVILFIYGWNQYLWPLLVTTDESMYTVVMGIQRTVSVPDTIPQWNLVMGTSILGLLPPVLVVLFMQRLFIKGLVDTEK